jgi:hypothetical protein
MRGQDAVVGQQRAARGGDERRQAFEQLQRVQQQRGGAVAPPAAQLVEELAPGSLGQSVEHQRRAQEIAAEVLELVATVRPDGDVGVQAEALKPGAAWARGRRRGGRPETAEGLAGPGPEGDAALQRRGDGGRQQRFLGSEPVGPAELVQSYDCLVRPQQHRLRDAQAERARLPRVGSAGLAPLRTIGVGQPPLTLRGAASESFRGA